MVRPELAEQAAAYFQIAPAAAVEAMVLSRKLSCAERQSEENGDDSGQLDAEPEVVSKVALALTGVCAAVHLYGRTARSRDDERRRRLTAGGVDFAP